MKSLQELTAKNLGDVLLFRFQEGNGKPYFRLGGYQGHSDKEVELAFGGIILHHPIVENTTWINPEEIVAR